MQTFGAKREEQKKTFIQAIRYKIWCGGRLITPENTIYWYKNLKFYLQTQDVVV
jgi:hypothetical protein